MLPILTLDETLDENGDFIESSFRRLQIHTNALRVKIHLNSKFLLRWIRVKRTDENVNNKKTRPKPKQGKTTKHYILML